MSKRKAREMRCRDRQRRANNKARKDHLRQMGDAIRKQEFPRPIVARPRATDPFGPAVAGALMLSDELMRRMFDPPTGDDNMGW